MLVSREYVAYLAKQITSKLIEGEFIDTSHAGKTVEGVNAALLDEMQLEDRINDEVRLILEELLKQEERIDAAARQKIESQRRTITEGSQEWDILYRKYYNEEVKKLGI